MRRIYFVRHGLTFSNEKRLIQDAHDQLSPKGIQQASILAERFSKIPFNTLLASDMGRAVHTAEIIAAKTGHVIKTSNLFQEVPYPSAFVGLSIDGPEALQYRAARKAHSAEGQWRFEDEESSEDLAVRAKGAFAFATEHEGDVLVVTHGKFLRHILFAHLFRGDISALAEQEAMGRLLTSNTGITVFEMREGEWGLLSWNDHAHLG